MCGACTWRARAGQRGARAWMQKCGAWTRRARAGQRGGRAWTKTWDAWMEMCPAWRGRYAGEMHCGRRWLIIKLLLSTLGGAVVTWAVAWGCALWENHHSEGPLGPDDSRLYWPRGVPAAWPPPFSAQVTLDRDLNGALVVGGERGDSDPRNTYFLIATVREYGWPARAMRGTEFEDDWVTVAETRFDAPMWLRPSSACKGLPQEILPAGFAIDAALSGLLVLEIGEGTGLVRRRWMARRGRCPRGFRK